MVLQGVITVTGLIDLKLLERDAFRKFYEDGLFDVFFGMLMVIMGLVTLVEEWLDSEAYSLLFMAGTAIVLVACLTVTRRRLLRSRLGEFEPGPERKRKITITRLALLTSVITGVIAFGIIAAVFRDGVSVASVEVFLPLIWLVNAVVVLSLMAYFLDVPRLYLHGLLFGSVMPMMIWPDALWDFKVEPLIAWGIPAAIIIAVGIHKLAHFLNDYPAQPTSGGEAQHGV